MTYVEKYLLDYVGLPADNLVSDLRLEAGNHFKCSGPLTRFRFTTILRDNRVEFKGEVPASKLLAESLKDLRNINKRLDKSIHKGNYANLVQ